MTPAHILLAEDDRPTREALERALVVEDYDVTVACNGREALALVARRPPDALILDVMMPILDGLSVCRELRARGDRTPVLIATAKEGLRDRIDGLDAGADDYLVKPFDLDELLARLRALLRRAYPNSSERLSYGSLTLHLATREATFEDETIQLTRTETSLLELFMLNPNQVLTRSILEERIWGWDISPASNPLAVYVTYLRRKLEASARPRLIHTVRGVGYRFGREG